MVYPLTRRQVVTLSSLSIGLAPLKALAMHLGLLGAGSNIQKHISVTDHFPTQSPELAREMVTVSHFSLQRVQELVGAQPSLARAAWDWGFGDWEDALGAASHTGNRAIAEYLNANGARPTLFSAAMLGELEVVRAHIAANPEAVNIPGPHSISLLAHAKSGGPQAKAVLEFLSSLGTAKIDELVPISPEEIASIIGSYPIGVGASEFVDVSLEDNRFLNTKELTWTRRGTTGRPLYHLGDKVFYPAGAHAVRIRFRSEKDRVEMTVEDSEVLFIALRS